MSGANSAANGASLEDCYTNIFALADLSGIKWKAYIAVDRPVPVGPLEDPVLSSYSKCLQYNILSVWRRVRHEGILDNSRQDGPPQWAKELWIFWYGEDPKFDELITYPELKEHCHGVWENSLSYECRTLLFKSLHNLIERRLLTQNYVRLGKWFVKPYPELPVNGENYSDHLSFKLSFFLHGESTVCSSVEVSQHPPVTKLTPAHLEATANGYSNGFQVILAPYGLSAFLYGQNYKGNSEQSQKAWQVLLEWSRFYPIKHPQSSNLSAFGGESEDAEGMMPPAVEVFVGGVRMLYPSCYIFVVQDDVSNMMMMHQQQQQQQQQQQPPQQPSHMSAVSPMPMAPSLSVPSPMPMAATPGQSYQNNAQGNTSVCSAPSSPQDAVYPVGDSSAHYSQRTTMVDACVGTAGDMEGGGVTNQLTQKVWKEWLAESDRSPTLRTNVTKTVAPDTPGSETAENHKPANSDSGAGPTAGSSEVKQEANQTPMWGFSDPTAKADCKCHRQKFLKSKQSVPFGKTPPGPGNSSHMSSGLGSNSLGPSSKHKAESRIEKTSKNSKSTIPFHMRTSMTEDYMYDSADISNERIPISVSAATPGTPGVSTGMNGVLQDMKGNSGGLTRFPQPSPMQRTPGSEEPPQANESPPSNTPSPLNPPPNGILGNPMDQPMPTLSPNPPQRSTSDSLGGIGSIASFRAELNGIIDLAKSDPNPKQPMVGELSVPKEEEDVWSCFELPPIDGSGDNKRPRLPSMLQSQEDLQDGALENLYEHDNSGERFSQPHKRLRQERRTRSTLDSNVFSLPNDVDNLQRVKTPDFDPYEFMDTSPPEGGSSSTRSRGKDGKGKQRNLQQRRNSIKKGKKQEEEAQRKAEGEKARQEAVMPVNVSYPNEPFRIRDCGVPTLPRQDSSSLTTEKDLQINLNEFQSLFESSDEDDDRGPLPKVSPDFPCGPNSEENLSSKTLFGSSISSSSSSGPHSGGDLGRMYPTPPSEEQTHCSPVNHPCPELSSNVTSYGGGQTKDMSSGPMNEQFEIEIEESLCSPRPEPLMDWSYVYKVPAVEKIVGATMYAPLKSLPSSRCPALKVPEYCIYKPSWQLPLSPKPELIPLTKESTIPMVPSVEMDLPASNQPSGLTPSAGIMASPAMYPGSQEPRSAANPDPSPAASEASSFRNLNSIEPPPSAALCPESHSLYTILGLSDSHLNIFKDCNFDSAVICACNMDIKGADLSDVRDYFSLSQCNCGFSAVMNRRYAVGSGLFSEDESEITGQRTDAPLWAYHRDNPYLTEIFNQKQLLPRLQTFVKDGVEELHRTSKIVLKLIQDQCHSPYSSLQNLLSMFRQRTEYHYGQIARSNLEYLDACDACVSAMDDGRQLTDSAGRGSWDPQYLRHRCLHTWAYNPGYARVPLSSQDIVQVLRSLQPLLHDAIQKKRTKRLWERPYAVQGPLTWQVFFNIAIQGTSESPEPLPVPPLLVGYEKDWMSSSPYAVLYWEKLLLEPFSSSRDIAYIALVPDQEFICKSAKTFFKELTSVYESCNLGRHVPMAKSMRNGILRIGPKYASKVESEQVDSWFSDIQELPEAAKIKVFAQVCKAYVAPYLMKDPPDVSMFSSQPAKMDRAYAAHSTTPASSSAMGSYQTAGGVSNGTSDLSTKGTMAAPTSKGVTPSDPTKPSHESKEESSPEIAAHADFIQPPGVVIYVVDPFTCKEDEHPDFAGISTLGLLRCFAEIVENLPEKLVKNIAFQIIPLHQVLQVANSNTSQRQISQLKSLAFSVFSQCHQTVNPSLPGRSLTGFGPAAELDKVIKGKESRTVHPNQVYSPPYILAPLKDKQTELGESFGDLREACGELFCTYCLSHDQRFLLTACTDNKGELNETAIINIDIPNSKRRKKVSVNNRALLKLWEFLLGVISKSSLPWRLVIGRFGRLGQGEVRDWSALLSRRSLTSQSLKLKDACGMCSVPGSSEYPCILSACLVSLEPETGLRIMADSVALDKCSKSSQRDQPSCQLHTPDDATCTHIMVFPTSATKQDASVTYNSEPIMDLTFPNPVDAVPLEDDLLNASDIVSLFDIPIEDEVRSPNQLDHPLVGSPSALPTINSIGNDNGVKSSGGLPENVLPVEAESVLQQPLALGYFVSTARTGNLPKWFWSPCPEAETNCPVFLKAALHVHNGSVQQTSDDLYQKPHTHPLDSNLTTDVLRYVLETYNGLSWLTVDPATGDRRSCLPIHMVVLMQLYNTVAALL